MNKKITSKPMGSLASNILNNDNASNIQRKLAGSVLSQRNPSNQTGSDMEHIAAKVLSSNKYSDNTKSLAASFRQDAKSRRRHKAGSRRSRQELSKHRGPLPPSTTP
jgi:hypothetical protein